MGSKLVHTRGQGSGCAPSKPVNAPVRTALPAGSPPPGGHRVAKVLRVGGAEHRVPGEPLVGVGLCVLPHYRGDLLGLRIVLAEALAGGVAAGDDAGDVGGGLGGRLGGWCGFT